MSTSASKTYYTVEQANQTLPLVRSIVVDIVRQYQELNERKERITRIRQSRSAGGRSTHRMYDDELRQVEDELEADVARLQEYVEELDRLGVELKDFGRGLVDFPTIRNGREVYLCWHLGESNVGFWHELDGGFRGRQPLEQSERAATLTPSDGETGKDSPEMPDAPSGKSSKKVTR
jgi:hypothetical protein